MISTENKRYILEMLKKTNTNLPSSTPKIFLFTITKMSFLRMSKNKSKFLLRITWTTENCRWANANYDLFSACSLYMFEKLHSWKLGWHSVYIYGEMFEEICFYLTRLWNNFFLIVKSNIFWIDGGWFVLGLFYILSMKRLFFCRDPPTFVLKRLF